MNWREEYIVRHKEWCLNHLHRLNGWEREFIENIQSLSPILFSTRQYNKLHDIAEKLKSRVVETPIVAKKELKPG